MPRSSSIVKSPVEFVIGTARELGVRTPALQLVRAMTLMGQELFNPPNVGGWPGSITWINASTLVERFNFAGLLADRLGAPAGTASSANGSAATPAAGAASLQTLLQGSTPTDAAGLVNHLLTRFVGVGATPATQAALLDYLGNAPPVQDVRARGLLQLVLGSPEYQLN